MGVGKAGEKCHSVSHEKERIVELMVYHTIGFELKYIIQLLKWSFSTFPIFQFKMDCTHFFFFFLIKQRDTQRKRARDEKYSKNFCLLFKN